jgi:hypothetical protein
MQRKSENRKENKKRRKTSTDMQRRAGRMIVWHRKEEEYAWKEADD